MAIDWSKAKRVDTPAPAAPIPGPPATGAIDWTKARRVQDAPETNPVTRALRDTGVALAAGVNEAGSGIVGLADLVSGGRAGKALEPIVDFQGNADYWRERYSPETKEAKQRVSEVFRDEGVVAGLGEAIRNPSSIATAAVESLPSMFAGGAIAKAAKAVPLVSKLSPVVRGAVGEGAISAGSAAESTRQASETGDLTGKQAALSAASGVGTALFGIAGGKIAQRLGIGDLDTYLARTAADGVDDVAKKLAIRQVLEGAVSEGLLEELPQSTQEQVLANLANGRPIEEGVAEAAGMGALVGGAMGSGFNVFQLARDRLAPSIPQEGAAPGSEADQAAAGVAPPASPTVMPAPEEAPDAAGPIVPPEIEAAAAAGGPLSRAVKTGIETGTIPTNVPMQTEGAPRESIPDRDLISPSAAQALSDLSMQNRDRTRPASIQQMQAIAQAPDYDRIGVAPTPDVGAPMVSAVQNAAELPAPLLGKRAAVTFADGQKVPVQYAVVEAGSVLASHAADGTVNQAYYQAQPGQLRALNNGRVAGMQAAYGLGTADQYKQALMADAANHGVDPQVIAGMQAPVLVRLFDDTLTQTQDLGRKSNVQQGLGYSATETALNDARTLDLSDFTPSEEGDVLAASNAPFLKRFMQAVPENERAALTDANRQPTRQLADRVQSAIFARAYRDPALVSAQAEEADPDVRNILRALTLAAPSFAKVERGELPGKVAKAALFIQRARRRGVKVPDALAQTDAFERDEDMELIAQLMDQNARSPRRLAIALEEIGRLLHTEQEAAKTGDIFGDRPSLTNQEIIDRGRAAAAPAEAEDRGRDKGGRAQGEPGQDQRAVAEDAAAYRVEALKKRYFPNERQLEIDWDAIGERPDASPETRAAADRAVSAVLFGRLRTSVLGLGISLDFLRTGRAQLVGQKVTSPADLAVAAQVYRDPRFETLRILFTKGNQIIDETGITCRLPSIAAGFKGDWKTWMEGLALRMARINADGYYLLHNHPSGIAHPSMADEGLTRNYAKVLPGFKGHVVIDTNQYGEIDADGNSTVHRVDFGEDRILSPSVPHQLLGEMVGGPMPLAKAAKQAQVDENQAVIIGTDNRARIRTILSIDAKAIEKKNMRAIALLRRLVRAHGNTRLFVITSKPHMGPVWLMGEKYVEDMIDRDTGRAMSDLGYRGGAALAEPRGIELPARVVEERTKKYGDTSAMADLFGDPAPELDRIEREAERSTGLQSMSDAQLETMAARGARGERDLAATEIARRKRASAPKKPIGYSADLLAGVDEAAHQAATSTQNDLPQPTAAQKEAGNYAKGHVTVAGLDISIENPAGSRRRPEWPPLKSHYGYIKGTVGKDKDHLDVFIKPGTPTDHAGPVFVIDQNNQAGRFDEHKIMLGWPDEAAARAGYLENYTKGWTGLGAITPMTLEQFKDWIDNGDTKRPLGETDRPAGETKSAAGETITIDGREYDLDAPNFGLQIPPQTIPDGDPLLTPTDQLPNREGLRQRIIDQHFEGKTPVERPVLYIMGGGGASGKGTVKKKLIESGAIDPSNAVVLDPDEIKARDIPEYQQIVARGDSRAASVVHEESSIVSKAIRERARDGKYNLILDVTLANREKSLRQLREFKAAGYEIRLYGVVVEPRTALVRAFRRAEHSFRYVPPSELLKAHQQFPQHFKAYAEIVDRAVLIDNEGEDPKILANKPPRLAKLAIVDDGAYNEVVRRAEHVNAEADTLRGVYARAVPRGGESPPLRQGGVGQDDRRAAARGDRGRQEVPEGQGRQAGDGGAQSRGPVSHGQSRDLFESPRPETGDGEGGGVGRPAGEQGGGPLGRRLAQADQGARGERPAAAAGEGAGREGVRRPQDTGAVSRHGRDRGDTTGRSAPAAPSVVSPPAVDHTIDDADQVGAGGAKTKARQNIEAIRLVKQLEEEDRHATAEERVTLSRYVGWGGIKQIFNPKNEEFTALREELRAALTPQEYAAARRSQLDAHFTSLDVVDGMWSMMERLGFRGGRVLEPSMGSGNFFGRMPADIRAKSGMYGVELDAITGKIAKYLYPNATIADGTGFQDVTIPADSFDVAIGNPPFGSDSLFDKNYKEFQSFPIHGFFFAKSLASLRPGGLMIKVVSRYLMDSTAPEARKVREYIANNAKLVGAFRLPDSAFRANAGTDVVTDILVLQKYERGEKPDLSWLDTKDMAVPTKGGEPKTFPVNAWYHEHPELVLGKQTATGKMYEGESYNVEASEGALRAAIEKAAKFLPENIYRDAGLKVDDLVRVTGLVPPGTKVYGMFLSDDGTVHQRTPDVLGKEQSQPVEFRDATSVDRAKGMIGIRDGLYRLIRMELSETTSDAALNAARARLNSLYDAFQKKYGYINRDVNRRIFRDDPGLPLLESLEVNYDPGLSAAVAKQRGESARPPSAKKADIFTKRVMQPYKSVTSVTNAQDALAASLNEKGSIDLEYMADIYDKEPEAILEELGDLVFKDPQGGYQPRDLYLSGNVKEKERIARAAYEKTGDEAFKRSADALREVFPADKSAKDIFVKMGSYWLPGDVLAQFAKEVLGAKQAGANYIKAVAKWSIGAEGFSFDAGREWGTARLDPGEIMAHVANNKAIVIKDNLGSSREPHWVVNEEATEEARAKAEEMGKKFREWIWMDPERRRRLEEIYNRDYNTDVPRRYDGSHLRLPGVAPGMKFRPHIVNAIWRAIQDRSILLDHVVGAGKTPTLTAIMMEFRRLGIARKPMIAVPNHLVRQWRDEIYKFYPNANVLATTEKDFEKANRRRLFARIATGDWDMVVVGHSSFKKIGPPPEWEERIYSEQLQEISDAIEQAKAERGDRNIARDMERIKRSLEEKMKALKERGGAKDDVVDFAEMGVDALGVDEAHEFKNLFYASQMRNVSGMGSPNGSGKAMDLFVKSRYLNERFAGRAPIVFATGTPVSNSLVEMFTMQRYMAWNRLKGMGLHHLDAWASMYGDVQNVYEVHPSGTGYRLSARFAKFANLGSLMALYKSFSDIVPLQTLKDNAEKSGGRFPVPKIKGGKPQNIVADRSDLQSRFFGVPEFQRDEAGAIRFEADPGEFEVIADAEKEGQWRILRAGSQKPMPEQYDSEAEAQEAIDDMLRTPKVGWNKGSILWMFENLKQLTRDSKGKVNALSITNLARKAGLDYRLIDPSAPDNPGSKVNLAVENAARIYKQSSADKGTQLIFCDLSTPKSENRRLGMKERPGFVRNPDGSLRRVRATLMAAEGADAAFLAVKTSRGVELFDGITGASTGIVAENKAEAKDMLAARIEGSGLAWLLAARERAATLSEDEILAWKDENEEAGAEESAPEDEITLTDVMAMTADGAFSVYDDIKQKLVDRGIREDEIAFIHDADTQAKKQELFKKVNAGKVRILLGSTPKMGAGTNVQKRLVGLHHLDAPWRPSDLEQREGRIIRQGNELYERDPDGFEVEILRYGTKQTYDTRMWQLIEHKASGVEQLRNYNGEQNEIEDIAGEAANASDMKAAASGNPLILDEIQLRNEVRSLEAQQRQHQYNEIDMQERLARLRRAPERYAQAERVLQPLIEHAAANPRQPFKYQIGNKTITEHKDIALPLTKAYATALNATAGKEDGGTYRGGDILFMRRSAGEIEAYYTPKGGDRQRIASYLEGADGAKFSPSGLLTRIDNYLEGAKQQLADRAAMRDEDLAQIPEIEARLGRPFPKDAELKGLRQRHREIVARLRKSGGGIELTPAMKRELEATIQQRLGGYEAPRGAMSAEWWQTKRRQYDEALTAGDQARADAVAAEMREAQGRPMAAGDESAPDFRVEDRAAARYGDILSLNATEKPRPEQPFLVVRVGAEPTLNNVNAGNLEGAAEFLMDMSDIESPTGGRQRNPALQVFRVTAHGPAGMYQRMNGGRPEGKDYGRAFGVSMSQSPRWPKQWYSFREGGAWDAEHLMTIPLEEVRSAPGFGTDEEATRAAIAAAIGRQQGMVREDGEPYSSASDALMGFGRRPKGFDDQKYRHVQYVRVTWPDGDTIVDAIKGLNKAHALERARRNWGGATITEATEDEFNAAGVVRENVTPYGQSPQQGLPGVPPAPQPPGPIPPQVQAGFQGNAAPNSVWSAPAMSTTDDIIYALQNKHIDTKRVVDLIKQRGQVADKWDASLQEELFHGRASDATDVFIDKELRPLINEMRLRKVTLDELQTYLWNRHAEERNAQIAKVNLNMPDGGSGIKTADARAYLAGLDPQKKRHYEALAKRVDAITKGTRALLVSSGLESQDMVNKWERAYKHYVPLFREDTEGGGRGTGQGFSTRGRASARAMGSEKDAVDILANLVMQREKTIVRAEKNRVAQALYGLAISAPNRDFWLPVNPSIPGRTGAQRQQLIGELVAMGLNPADAQNVALEPRQQYIDPRTGLVTERINPALRGRANVLTVKYKGEDRLLFFNEDDPRATRMVEALKNLDVDHLGTILKTMGMVTRVFAKVNTQWNPIFGVVNFMRDVQGAMFNLSSTPLAGKQAAVARNVLPALKGIYGALRRGGGGQWARLWEEFQREGGKTGYRDMFATSAERTKALEAELRRLSEGKAKAAGRAIFQWLEDYNDAMENSTRLAAYKVALDSGMSKQRAAALAKNLTVNFNKKGQIATQAGAMYAFFNAAVQGTTRMAETLKGPMGRRIFFGGLAVGVAQALLLAAAGYDQDDPPEFVRERNIIIPLGGKRYATIPMPLGFHVIPGIGRSLTEWALSGFRDTPQRGADLFGMFMEAFNPIGNAGLSVQTITPTAVDPLVALSENRDWTGTPIARKDFNSLAPTPGYTRAKDTATWLSKQLSYYLNRMTGGTDYKPGVFSPTPDQIDYLIGQVAGGVGRELGKAQQFVESRVTGEELPPYKVPLLGRFYGRADGQQGQGNRFYDNIIRLNMHEAEIKGRMKNREPVADYLRENPDARLASFANKAERQVSKLRKAKREAVARGAPTGQIKLIDQQITNTMRQFNESVAAARAQ